MHRFFSRIARTRKPAMSDAEATEQLKRLRAYLAPISARSALMAEGIEPNSMTTLSGDPIPHPRRWLDAGEPVPANIARLWKLHSQI